MWAANTRLLMHHHRHQHRHRTRRPPYTNLRRIHPQ
jgi:hypothetical protein